MNSDPFMLDTNTVSYLMKGNRAIREHLQQTSMNEVSISVITEAELLTGVQKKGNPPPLRGLVGDFLARVEVLPWDSMAAKAYARTRAQLESSGTPLGNMDLLIAAHAIAANRILVTSDKGFQHARQWLSLTDWTQAPKNPR